MPPHVRRRNNKIVEQQENQEITGGIKNALERGESMEKAKASFINAGYKKTEVDKANPDQKTSSQPEQNQTKKLPQQPQQKKQISKKLWIILIIITILILVSAGIIGLFWKKII